MSTKFLSWSLAACLGAAALTVTLQKYALADCQTRDGKISSCSPKPLRWAKSALVEFGTSPFPYDGIVPDKDKTFLDVTVGKRKGHKTESGRVLWEDVTFRERRVLLHIPKGFDFARPGVMVVFFHGHRAILSRDVQNRQLVATQISASGMNAVLVAPQFAIDAVDSSPGKFWVPGAFRNFVEEASNKLAELHGNSAAAEAFSKMPVILVAYSGGYLATAWCLEVGGANDRLRGVVLLDALYGRFDKFVTWITHNRSSFFVSAYTQSTEKENEELKATLTEHEIKFEDALKQNIWNHGVTFLPTDFDTKHENFVTQAWADYPISDILRRLDEFRQ
jgi:hypothetical protein